MRTWRARGRQGLWRQRIEWHTRRSLDCAPSLDRQWKAGDRVVRREIGQAGGCPAEHLWLASRRPLSCEARRRHRYLHDAPLAWSSIPAVANERGQYMGSARFSVEWSGSPASRSVAPRSAAARHWPHNQSVSAFRTSGRSKSPCTTFLRCVCLSMSLNDSCIDLGPHCEPSADVDPPGQPLQALSAPSSQAQHRGAPPPTPAAS